MKAALAYLLLFAVLVLCCWLTLVSMIGPHHLDPTVPWDPTTTTLPWAPEQLTWLERGGTGG